MMVWKTFNIIGQTCATSICSLLKMSDDKWIFFSSIGLSIGFSLLFLFHGQPLAQFQWIIYWAPNSYASLGIIVIPEFCSISPS